MNPLTRIPAQYRYWIYAAYFLLGVILGAFDVAGASSFFGTDLGTFVKVYAYVGTALGLAAASNVTHDDEPKPAPESNVLRGE